MDLLERRRTMLMQGPKPIFYNYLLFDGTAYIDTDIIPNTDFSFESAVGYETLSAAQRLYGVPCTEGYTQVFQSSSTTSATRYFSIYYGSESALKTRNVARYYPAISYFNTPNRIGWGDSAETFTKGNGVPNGPIVIGSTATHSGQPYTGGFSTIHLYGSDAQNATTRANLITYTPTVTLRPCIYEGESGLWNVEQNKFYGNSAGSGTLIAATQKSLYPVSYDTTNYSYASVNNISNAYASYSSNTSGRINLKTGQGAETYIYFNFNTSSIPENATILRVFCTARAYASTTNGNMIATRNVRLYSGSTAKGTATTIDNSSNTYLNVPCGTWTRSELENAKLRVYAKRGANGVNSNYYITFYGATLIIFYTV